MAGEPTRGGQRRGSKLFVDRQYYERGAAGGRIVTVSRRTQVLLAAGFALSTILCIVLVGLGVLGYRLYLEQGARLAALEAPELEPGAAESSDTGAGPDAVAGGALAELLQAGEARIGTLEQELALARDDLAAAGTASVAVDERLTREQEALRLKLENADRMRLDAETELAASRARIAAMEAELGAGGTAEKLVDATGQPLASLEGVTPGDLAQLGMELRLVERERDGAREQLDRSLERLAVLEVSVVADPAATANAADATADRLAELELAQSALQSENTQLTARLERRIAEQGELRAAAEAGRRELVTQIASAETRIADEAARNSELEARLVALQQELESAVAERATVIAERDAATENAAAAAEARDVLGRERDQLVEAQAILTAERDTLATVRDTLAAEREALMMGRDTLATERDDLRARLAEAETATTDMVALRAELAAALEASRAAEAELLDRDAERAALETSLAAEQERVASLTAELSARGLSETADDSVAEDGVADGEAALAALEERNRELEAAVATAEAEADRATALASDATLLAERSATVEPSIITERDTALASAAAAAAEVQRLRDDNATLTKASRDALDAQGAAHEAVLEELRAELVLLQDAVTARDSENAELLVANEQLAAARATEEDGSTSAALRAANERIKALEEELAVTARLAAELGNSPGAVPISTTDVATVNGTASAAELELALERIKDLDAELSAAESRVSELQSLLGAEWPGPPRAAPR